ncbi:exo-alpha-sialidase [Flavobacterium procerum]|uniref:Exo-alpha-sialidase n=1 Tax=Flavobacterium procerum TaxID=1455569 RepID=A0ABV6BR83_9FLAO
MILKFKYTAVLFALVCFSCLAQKTKYKAVNIESNFVADPPVTAASHAATLVEINPNEITAAWFGGKYEGAKDVGIYISSYKNKKWSAPQNIINPLIRNGDTLPCWNPVLFKSKSSNLYLFYKVGKNPREWFGAMMVSKDNGKTWGEAKYLPDGILGPIRNKPIETTPGVIICGSSTETVDKNIWNVHVEEYTEASDSWKKIEIENPKNLEIIQPTFLIHSANQIQMLSRSKHNKVVSSWSNDNGKSWKKTDTINVVNSNSGIDALTINKKLFLLVNNPLPQGKDWFYGRNILDVEYSNDGLKWTKLFDLEHEEKGEFSYPAIIQTTDQKIHVLYTHDRKFIKHTVFELK